MNGSNWRTGLQTRPMKWIITALEAVLTKSIEGILAWIKHSFGMVEEEILDTEHPAGSK
jgi:hypothetical protein